MRGLDSHIACSKALWYNKQQCSTRSPSSLVTSTSLGAAYLSPLNRLGSADHVIGPRLVRNAMADRGDRPLVILDLAVPRDTDPAVARLDGVEVVTLDDLALANGAPTVGADAAARLVDDEVAAFAAVQRASGAGSTVVALRAMAADVVAVEMARLRTRLDGAPPATIDEFERTLNRVVDKLLHAPTVRVKELGAEPSGTDYVTALRELFALDPRVVDVVTHTLPARTEPDQP